MAEFSIERPTDGLAVNLRQRHFLKGLITPRRMAELLDLTAELKKAEGRREGGWTA